MKLHAGAIVFMCVAVPFVLPVLVPLLVGFVYIRKRYIMTSREVRLCLCHAALRFSSVMSNLAVLSGRKQHDGSNIDGGCAVQVKRFDSVTRSPVYASFGAMLKVHFLCACPCYRPCSQHASVEYQSGLYVAASAVGTCFRQ